MGEPVVDAEGALVTTVQLLGTMSTAYDELMTKFTGMCGITNTLVDAVLEQDCDCWEGETCIRCRTLADARAVMLEFFDTEGALANASAG